MSVVEVHVSSTLDDAKLFRTGRLRVKFLAVPERTGLTAGTINSGCVSKVSARSDRRIRAVATVSAVDVGAATRKGWDGKASAAEQLATLELSS